MIVFSLLEITLPQVESITTHYNAVGCDSVVTMNLTIHNSKATNDSAVACDNYTWNGNVYDTSGIYIDTLQTIHGCDSIVTMDTINDSYYIEESLIVCDSMTWNNGHLYPKLL